MYYESLLSFYFSLRFGFFFALQSYRKLYFNVNLYDFSLICVLSEFPLYHTRRRRIKQRLKLKMNEG